MHARKSSVSPQRRTSVLSPVDRDTAPDLYGRPMRERQAQGRTDPRIGEGVWPSFGKQSRSIHPLFAKGMIGRSRRPAFVRCPFRTSRRWSSGQECDREALALAMMFRHASGTGVRGENSRCDQSDDWSFQGDFRPCPRKLRLSGESFKHKLQGPDIAGQVIEQGLKKKGRLPDPFSDFVFRSFRWISGRAGPEDEGEAR
jgi:hypothetical protein